MVNSVGCHVCVIYPPKSIKLHNCAVVSDRTFISGLNTSGGGGVGISAVARAAQVRVVYRPHWLGSGMVPGTIKHGV